MLPQLFSEISEPRILPTIRVSVKGMLEEIVRYPENSESLKILAVETAADETASFDVPILEVPLKLHPRRMTREVVRFLDVPVLDTDCAKHTFSAVQYNKQCC